MNAKIRRRDAESDSPSAPRRGDAEFRSRPENLGAIIVDGMNNHDWAAGTRAIRSVLEQSGPFTVDVSTWPKLPDFSRYDVLIHNFNGGHTESGVRWPAAAERALEGYVARGGGLVVFHAANSPLAGVQPDDRSRIGVRRRSATVWRSWRGKCAGSPKAKDVPPGHGPRHDFELIVLTKKDSGSFALPPHTRSDPLMRRE